MGILATSFEENSFFTLPPSFNPQINFCQGRPEGSSVFARYVIKCRSSGLITIKGNESFDLECFYLFICFYLFFSAQNLQSSLPVREIRLYVNAEDIHTCSFLSRISLES